MNRKGYGNKKVIFFGILMVVLIGVAVCLLLQRAGKQSDPDKEENSTANSSEELSSEITEQEIEASLLENGEKTVYAKADARGNVKEISVETLVKDEDGEEFRYKEETEEGIPVYVHISYSLDGEPIEPGDLAGKSGKVKIRFDYENLSAKQKLDNGEGEVPVPFTVITALVLPSETFSNVEATNGKLISMEGQNMVVGYAIPGISEYLQLESYEPTEEMEIPEYVEITADASEFELAFTATVMTTGIFEDLEEEDLSDAEEMADSMEELSDASAELVKGTGELYDGMEKFKDYLDEYAEGVSAVSKGAKALKDGAKTLNDKKAELENGADALRSGLEALYEALAATEDGQQLTEEQKELLATVESLKSGSQALAKGIGAFNDGVGELYTGAKQLSKGTSELTSAGEELSEGFSDVLEGVKSLKDGVKEFDSEGIQELEKLAGEELKTIVSRLRKLKEADGNWNGFLGDLKAGDPVKVILETEEIKK